MTAPDRRRSPTNSTEHNRRSVVQPRPTIPIGCGALIHFNYRFRPT
jgi:hypothetical protein